VSVGGFIALLWRDLPLGATLTSPEGPLAVVIYHLVPFLCFSTFPFTLATFPRFLFGAAIVIVRPSSNQALQPMAPRFEN
jgi:hypothetical protein